MEKKRKLVEYGSYLVLILFFKPTLHISNVANKDTKMIRSSLGRNDSAQVGCCLVS